MPKNQKADLYRDIWQKFTEGDDDALSSIYFEFFDKLLNFGMKYSSDRFMVEDCIQNLFVDLLKNRQSRKPVHHLKFYLTRALRNQILYEHRKVKRLVPTDKFGETEFKITYSIEKSLIANETDEVRSRFLKMVMEELSDRQKEALYLKFNCGFDCREISELMDINVESARTLIYRTLKSIRETFDPEKYSGLILFSLFRSFLTIAGDA